MNITNPKIILQTERLILRPLTESDDEAIFDYSKNPNVGPNAGWKPHENIEETRAIMNTVFLKEGVFGIVLRKTGKLFGSLGLVTDAKRENDRTRMLGYAIGEDYWGHGYITEAARAVVEYGFVELKLDLISAYCFPFNARSKQVLEKLGFKYEGRLAQCDVRFDGEILDNECFALLAKDYKNE